MRARERAKRKVTAAASRKEVAQRRRAWQKGAAAAAAAAKSEKDRQCVKARARERKTARADESREKNRR